MTPREIVGFMQSALIDSAQSNVTILGCTLLDHRQRDGHRGATQYEVEIGSVDGADSSRKLVSALTLGGPRTRRLWRQIVETTPPDVIPGSGIRPFAYDAELDVLFQVYPFDARLPALRRLAPSPTPEIAAVLNAGGARLPDEGGSWTTELVRYRPDMRATVRLEMDADNRTRDGHESKFYAKVYRDPEQAHHAYTIQDSLHQELQGSSLLQVARPVAIASSYNTLITAAVAGAPLDRALRRGDDPAPQLRAAARAVAALHRLPTAAPMRSTSTEVDQVRTSGESVISTYPDLGSRVGAIVETVASELLAAPVSFVHGDLKPEHILVDDDGRAAMIDFDLAVNADPILDIAHFIAFLDRSASRSRSGPTLDANPISVFLDEYFAQGANDGYDRLRLYHAATAIHKAAGLCREPSPDNKNQAAQILDEGLRFLSGEADATQAPSFKRRMTRTG